MKEIIVVDSGTDRLSEDQLANYQRIRIRLVTTPLRSVCIQRNIGIGLATGNWIFLCDDDIELPRDYFSVLQSHMMNDESIGAITGVIRQKEGDEWRTWYPVSSRTAFLWRFLFMLGFWGEPQHHNGKRIFPWLTKRFYSTNKITSAGWPVITNCHGEIFRTKVYGLGAALTRKDWLMLSPYDEVLDAHGIGDNYDVAMNFPGEGIHVSNRTFAFHHREFENRLDESLVYFRRVLALDYFRRAKPYRKAIHFSSFIWSLFGNFLGFVFSARFRLAKAAVKSFAMIIFRQNPYVKGLKKAQKIIEPKL